MTDILGPPEIAEVLNVSQQWVTKLLREGKIKGKRMGRQWFVSRQAVEKYQRERSKVRK